MASEDVIQRIDQGMRVQFGNLETALAGGAKHIGWKIGITAKAAQVKYGLDGPIIAYLTDRTERPSGHVHPQRDGADFRVEAEIFLRMGEDLGAGATLDEARLAIAGMGPAIELIDLSHPGEPLDALLGHCIWHEAVLFGPESAPGKFRGADYAPLPQVLKNGEVARTPDDNLVPADLSALALHVANLLGRQGRRLKAGERIICGSFTVPLPVSAGDRIEVDFGDAGSVELSIGAP